MKEYEYHLKVTREQHARFQSIMESTGISSELELFNYVLTYFEHSVDKVAKGRIIASVDEEGMKYTEIILFPLEIVKALSAANRDKPEDLPDNI